MNCAVRLYAALRNGKTPVVLPLALTCVGIVALVLGEGASKAFANLGGSVVIRIMGVAMIAGGCLIVSSLVKYNALREVSGLALAAFGAAVYGGGAVLGLHSQGLVSGIGYAGITVTLLARMVFVVQAARVLDRASRQT
jgi:hypothetical protein